MSQNLDDYRTQHLLLLVGSNPLPNFVAARLLTKPDATVWLLHSDGADGEPSTGQAAERLRDALYDKCPDLKEHIHLEPIPSADSLEIYNRVQNIICDLKGEIGLSYAGGTKPMSVHTYRAIEHALADRTPRPVFSYLDPRKLALRIDRQGTKPGAKIGILKEPAIRDLVETSLEELAALHGYKRTKGETWVDPDTFPELAELCAAIAQVHSKSEGIVQWRRWMEEEKFTTLPHATKYPELKPVSDMLDNLCSGPGLATTEKVAILLRPHNPGAALVDCSKWFNGGWLEDHSLICIRQIASQLQLKSFGNRLFFEAVKQGAKGDRKPDTFDLDVAAILGYQLFAVSCITTEAEEKEGAGKNNDDQRKNPKGQFRNVKNHLFEVFVRARQMGGDEARIGLVCCVDDPGRLQEKIARDWDAEGKLRVFGRSDLQNLASKFADWFKTANQF